MKTPRASTAASPIPVIVNASPALKATISSRPNANRCKRDRGEQDDECGGAWEQSSGDADGEEGTEAEVFPVAVVMMVIVPVRVCAPVQPARPQNRSADRDDEQPGDEVEPRVQLVGNDEAREQQGDEAEREDADRVRHGHDQAEQGGVTRRAALADEVGRDDRLAVPRRKCVRHAPEQGRPERGEDDPGAEVIAPDERGEAASRRCGRGPAGPSRASHADVCQGLSLARVWFGRR